MAHIEDMVVVGEYLGNFHKGNVRFTGDAIQLLISLDDLVIPFPFGHFLGQGCILLLEGRAALDGPVDFGL